jgi:hypothetical protein
LLWAGKRAERGRIGREEKDRRKREAKRGGGGLRRTKRFMINKERWVRFYFGFLREGGVG